VPDFRSCSAPFAGRDTARSLSTYSMAYLERRTGAIAVIERRGLMRAAMEKSKAETGPNQREHEGDARPSLLGEPRQGHRGLIGQARGRRRNRPRDPRPDQGSSARSARNSSWRGSPLRKAGEPARLAAARIKTMRRWRLHTRATSAPASTTKRCAPSRQKLNGARMEKSPRRPAGNGVKGNWVRRSDSGGRSPSGTGGRPHRGIRSSTAAHRQDPQAITVEQALPRGAA